ncbi:gliding motility-associated C-terminal domain-containing protein [uncultured Eudoraea sp.]|uniref:gliding motility-associated C-terminal domain-containing protein n=1 Tax=uncultured Eudoraea sp. TaxID=1035614 RepID=UPI00262E1F9F|nr:gliding motility-associated C-terminal domain-containing protein [uncultured Eudoraea sp.]
MFQIRLVILLVVTNYSLFGQAGIHNFGNLQLHSKGHVGFHTDFTNDGSFDRNSGLIGFYQDQESLYISGAFSPTFYDLELAVEKNLYLDIPIHIDNSLGIIYGNIISSRANKNIYTKFTAKADYIGIANHSKIDGQVGVEGQKVFSFPVGYDDLLRPLQVQFIDDVFLAKCAYFFENPDYPRSFAKSFNSKNRDNSLGGINTQEFWNLTTTGRIQITLNWNSGSIMDTSINNRESITVAGWNKKNEQWNNLGNAKYEGTVSEGSVTSNIFNANDYEIFTLGFLFNTKGNEPGNYAITPNGDGINDFFSLKIIEQSPNNELKVFNRSGLLVYDKTNYLNEFQGISNRNGNQKNNYLPEGVYFYIIDLKDLNLKYQGYFYLTFE